MRMAELKSLARERRLRNYSRMRKAELVALLQMFYTIFLKQLKEPNVDHFQFVEGPVINGLGKKYSSYLTV